MTVGLLSEQQHFNTDAAIVRRWDNTVRSCVVYYLDCSMSKLRRIISNGGVEELHCNESIRIFVYPDGTF